MQDHTPLVSVVVATYAGDKLEHLREAIASVREQSYAFLEILIAIDGPVPHANRAMLETMAREDSRLRLITLDRNAGPASARNTAVAAAQGTYIAILDADDLACHDRIKIQLQSIVAQDGDLVGGWLQLIDERGRAIGEKHAPTTSASIRRWTPIINPIANSSVLARAEVLKTHPYPVGFRFGEDYALWITLISKGFSLSNVPHVVTKYRTGRDFGARRSGWHWFKSDLINKSRAVTLQSPWLQPFYALVVPLLAAGRLLPAAALAVVYRLRASRRLHRGKHG